MPVLARAAVAIVVGLTAGCAARGGGAAGAKSNPSPERQRLADLQPPLALPAPATRPAAEPPVDALIAYARGRDALLRNQKANAVTQLKTAVDLDAGSAIVWRDLGYAQIGLDDARAAAAFRQAISLDPADADSRLQLSRLLLAGKKVDEAVVQLRLARLSPDFTSDDGLAAVVDLLLGQCLEQGGYQAAALECYDHVLAIIDARAFDLRGRPELADVLTRPGILVLRTADLATQSGQYARAIELYERLQKQEPQSAETLELRLARTQLAAGDKKASTRRAFDVVQRSKASTLSLALFDELFEPYGGPAAALREVEALKGADGDTTNLLKAHLQLRTSDPAAAALSVAKVRVVSLPLVRLTVQAYRAAGREVDLFNALLTRTADDPARYGVIARGWAMLTHLGQPEPLTPEMLLAAPTDPRLDSVRRYTAAKLYEARGRVRSAERMRSATPADAVNPDGLVGGVRNGNENGPAFDSAAADAAPPLELTGLEDVSSSTELAVLVDAYRDDPELLMAVTADAIRGGQKRLVTDALSDVHTDRPTDPVVASVYAQALAGEDRRADAVGVLDKATAAAKSASELYFLASQYGGLGDEKAAERVLRQAHGIDADYAAVCNDLGYLLTDQGRELEFAESLLQTAVAAEPDNAAYLDSLGWLLYKRGKFAEAAGQLEGAVLAVKPIDPVVLDHAGDALYRSNNPTLAADRWRQAVEAIKERGTNDPQLRLRVEQKLRQLEQKSPVVVAPVANAE